MANIVAIFAHPDDESFGPGGTLAKLSKEHDVYIICVTSGDKGGNPKVREKELLDSAEILGIKEVFYLRYGDGDLSNNLYHAIADSVIKILDKLQPIKVITFEMRGVSGHIDHVAISMITTYLFEMKNYINEAWYFCISKEHRSLIDDYFICFPPGYEKNEVDVIVDVSEVWSQRIQAINCHTSQEKDMRETLSELNILPKEEYFLVKKKD